MDHNIKDQGIKYAAEAVKADREGSYIKAVNLYKRAAMNLTVWSKYRPAYEKRLINEKVNTYVVRINQLKKVLENQKQPELPLRVAEGPVTAVAKNVKENGRNGGAASGEEKKHSSDANVSGPWHKKLDLDAELSKIVGLESVKAELRDFKHQVELDKRRKELGFNVDTATPEHMCFMGNPGTGKTTVGRLIARIMHSAGILEKGHLVEVQRSDLVEGFIGQTALKTRREIEKAKGGVLFVDEAYRLVPKNGGSGKQDFGVEAINELMAAMGCGDPVMIFAGYVKDMRRFFAANEGLTRRISRQFHFEDLSIDQIVELILIKTKASPFNLAEDVTPEILKQILTEKTTPKQRSFMNGAIAGLIMRGAKTSLDRRLTLESADETNIMTFHLADLYAALSRLPHPPSDEGLASASASD